MLHSSQKAGAKRQRKLRFFHWHGRVKGQGFPRRGVLDEGIQILEHCLLLRRDVRVPHHDQEDYSLLLGVIPRPVQVARVHAQKPENINHCHGEARPKTPRRGEGGIATEWRGGRGRG